MVNGQTLEDGILIYFNEDDGVQNSIAAADFDNDGLKDVLMASSDPNVFWVRNLGDNQFGPKIPIFDEEIFGERVKPIDINKDGNMDIAAACSFSNVVVTIIGNGDGTFQDAIFLEEELEPLSDLKIFDVNMDGFDDIVYSTFDITDDIGRIYWNQNDGTGGFLSRVILDPQAFDVLNIEFADLDNDGLPDLISRADHDNKLAWFKNLGDGQFSDEIEVRPAVTSFGSRPLAVADMDSDGDVDLLTYENSNITLYSNDGDGAFTESSIELSSFTWGISARDYDRDGDVDIFCGSGGDKLAVLLESNGDGTFQDEQILATDIGQIIDIWEADMDNDGVRDVLTASALYDGFMLFTNTYNGPLSIPILKDKVEVTLFPNPTSDHVTITTEDAVIAEVEIIDISGRTVLLQKENNVREVKLSLNTMIPGYYGFIIRNDAGKVLSKQKLVKQ